MWNLEADEPQQQKTTPDAPVSKEQEVEAEVHLDSAGINTRKCWTNVSLSDESRLKLQGRTGWKHERMGPSCLVSVDPAAGGTVKVSLLT